MTGLAQCPNSCNSGNFDALRVAPPLTRPRFGSAPAATSFAALPAHQSRRQSSVLGHQPECSLWTCIGEGGKLLSQKSRHYVQTYAPVQWQASVLKRIDWIYDFVDSRILQLQPPNFHFTRENYLIQFQSWSAWLAIAAVVAPLVLLSFSLVATVTSKLALPFYAVFAAIYWLLVWRRDQSASSLKGGESATNLPQVLNTLWCAATFAETATLSIRYLIIGESLSSSDDWFDRLAHYGVPAATFVGAKLYLDHTVRILPSSLGRSSSQSDVATRVTSEQVLYLSAYFVLAYAVRYFSVRGFTLFPTALRPFLGYAAGYWAVLAFEKKVNWPAFMLQSNWRPCEHCYFRQGANRTSVSQPTVGNVSPVSPRPSGSNRSHVSPESDLLRFAPGACRSSRRVSLPAGPLAPIRGQSNLSEARGLIADMLAQKDMPPYLVSGLKAVSTLLLPANQSNNFLFSSTHLDFLGNLPRVLDTPYIGADASLACVETVGQRRQSPIVVTWSTTTSATGLPTVEPEPSRARSSSYWKQRRVADGENRAKETATPSQSGELYSTLLQLSDGTLYSLTELESDPKLARVDEWSLPIFDLYADSPETVLTRVAYTIFQRSDFFHVFKISKQKFFSFFHALEKGYWDIPYHNRIHAADVVHATYYFASSKVPTISTGKRPIVEPRQGAESQSANDGYDRGDEGSLEDDANDLATVIVNGLEESETLDQKNVGSLASVLSSLEVMALYTAAAMHDYDHPGRTNAFLVAIEDEKAILYNDRSVLENHHAAASWQLLNQQENNFVEHLDAAEFKRFRYMIIEAILATDLKRHFEILMDFNGKVGSGGLDWDNESDKLLTCQVCIKMADINSPAKPSPLHREWTNRIVKEFYAQGDEERKRRLPVSPYMDRRDPQLAKLQDSFITHLVAPLAQAMNDAGLLAIPPVPTDCTDTNAIPKSELLTNLECNQAYWKAQLDEGKEDHDGISASSNIPGENGAATEMETIQEQDDENGSPQADAHS